MNWPLFLQRPGQLGQLLVVVLLKGRQPAQQIAAARILDLDRRLGIEGLGLEFGIHGDVQGFFQSEFLTHVIPSCVFVILRSEPAEQASDEESR